MALKYGNQLAELHDLVDIVDRLLERADRGRIQPSQARKIELRDLRRRTKRELAFKLKLVGDVPYGAVSQFVGDLNPKRQLAFKLIPRANANRDRPRLAPAPQRMLIVGRTRVLGRYRFCRRDQLMLDGRIGALDEWERDEFGKIEGRRRPRKRKARLGHIHMQLLLDALAHSIDCHLDIGLDIARKRGEELLLDRSRLRPILEANKSGIRID